MASIAISNVDFIRGTPTVRYKTLGKVMSEFVLHDLQYRASSKPGNTSFFLICFNECKVQFEFSPSQAQYSKIFVIKTFPIYSIQHFKSLIESLRLYIKLPFPKLSVPSFLQAKIYQFYSPANTFF